MKHKKIPSMVMKLDLSKAYDMSSWLNMILLLLHVGFSVHVVKWIMGCLTPVYFEIIINGLASKFSTPSTSLRWGCPISPFLLLVITKESNRAILEAMWEGAIYRVLSRREISLTYLLFIEDVLFINGSSREAKNLKEILYLYYQYIGMAVNFSKFTISFNSMEKIQEKKMIQMFPFKHLGFIRELNIWYFPLIQMVMEKGLGMVDRENRNEDQLLV